MGADKQNLSRAGRTFSQKRHVGGQWSSAVQQREAISVMPHQLFARSLCHSPQHGWVMAKEVISALLCSLLGLSIPQVLELQVQGLGVTSSQVTS